MLKWEWGTSCMVKKKIMLLFGTKKVDGHTSPKYSVVFCTLADDCLWCKRDIKYKTCNIWEGRVWTSRWLNLEFLLRNNDVRPRHLAPVSIFPLVGQLHGRVQWLLQHATIVTVGHLFFWQFHPTVAEGFAVEGWAFFLKILFSFTQTQQMCKYCMFSWSRIDLLTCRASLSLHSAWRNSISLHPCMLYLSSAAAGCFFFTPVKGKQYETRAAPVGFDSVL